MRLHILDSGHSRPQRLVLWLMKQFVDPVPGPVLTMSYRRDFFGKYMAAVLQECMREMHEWSVTDVELFSAFVSSQNSCRF
ncbi:MAG: hypothetical protein MJE77_16540 [Proteobacteria bacterium]|nr:hypothetical protein [Pseudomonadota bacterium]